jgi:hypothetical protein
MAHPGAAGLELMRPFEGRPLTSGEQALGELVFADEVDWPRVRLVQWPRFIFGAMVPFGRTIYFSAWRAPRDTQGWLIHEMTHIWQAAKGIVLAGAKLQALGRGAYVYAFTPGRPFKTYNIEQQAEIARHLFLARRGNPEPGAPERQALEALWPIRASPVGAPVIIYCS